MIVAPRHLEAALTIIPDWWGVVVVDRGTHSGVNFRRIRAERVNRAVEPVILARLLWRPEAQAILRELGVPERDLRAPREALYQRIVSEMPLRRLAHTVRETLKSRLVWRDQPQPS